MAVHGGSIGVSWIQYWEFTSNAFTFNLELNKTYLVYWSEDKSIPPAKCDYTEYDSA